MKIKNINSESINLLVGKFKKWIDKKKKGNPLRQKVQENKKTDAELKQSKLHQIDGDIYIEN